MSFSEKMKEYLDKGLAVSKDALSKAGASVQDFGDKSVIRIEIRQLQSKLDQEYQKLGVHAAEVLFAGEGSSVTAEDSAVKASLDTVASLEKEISVRNDLLKKASEPKK